MLPGQVFIISNCGKMQNLAFYFLMNQGIEPKASHNARQVSNARLMPPLTYIPSLNFTILTTSSVQLCIRSHCVTDTTICLQNLSLFFRLNWSLVLLRHSFPVPQSPQPPFILLSVSMNFTALHTSWEWYILYCIY